MFDSVETIQTPRHLPRNYTRYAFEEATKNPSFKTAFDYLIHFSKYAAKGKGLLLLGPNGVGKTGYLAALYNTIRTKFPMLPARDIVWCRAVDVAQVYGYGYVDSDLDIPVNELYNNAKFMFVDELGREDHIKNAPKRMHSLFTARRDRGRLTYATSNLHISKIAPVYGEGFFSVLHETCVITTVDGPDRRMQQ